MQCTFCWFEGFFNFEKPFIEKICCRDEVDCSILQTLYEAGRGGMLPKNVAARLSAYKITRHHVSRRLKCMNKRLMKENWGSGLMRNVAITWL